MNLIIYDPPPGHEYLTKMFFLPMIGYASSFRSGDILYQSPSRDWHALSGLRNGIVITSADNLTPEFVERLKLAGHKIVGFSCTDSSYISQACRPAMALVNLDLVFMLSGIQKVNHGREMVVDSDFNIRLEDRQFLPDDDWAVFDRMRKEGRLQSLPYPHWERQPPVSAQPYASRSQKALIRGGNHMRRFLLALHLMNIDKLDVNSGFYTAPYFRDDMNPQFRYCEDCRAEYRAGRGIMGYPDPDCANPFAKGADVSLNDLGGWNNKCPRSFMSVASQITAGRSNALAMSKLLNAQWLTQEDHLKLLARITFTTDLKWLFSIYAPQRFWDAAMVGCLNILPRRTNDQQFWPEMNPGEHYLTFSEDLQTLPLEFDVDEKTYNEVSANAKALYDSYMRPTEFAIGTPILERIFSQIERHCT